MNKNSFAKPQIYETYFCLKVETLIVAYHCGHKNGGNILPHPLMNNASIIIS